MTSVVPLWLSTSYKPAFRCGGWAFIRIDPGGLFATAGGLRRATQEGMRLSALLAGLADLKQRPAAGAETIVLRIAPGERKGFGALLAQLAGKGDPADPPLDPAAREAVLKGLNRRGLRLGPPLEADDPALAFLMAWADLAREKATAGGAFSASIPKSNLSKISRFVVA